MEGSVRLALYFRACTDNEGGTPSGESAAFVASFAVAATVLAPTTAPPAAAADVGQGFTITTSDLAYILKQIKIAEAHVANTTSETGPCGP